MEALKDKRGSEFPVPGNLSDYLNEAQLCALRRVEELGWQLQFVRRPMFQDPVPVVVSVNGEQHAVLEEDGTINMHPDLVIR